MLTILTALQSGALAALLCMLYRDCRVLNLAAAAWLLVGGWIAFGVSGGSTSGLSRGTTDHWSYLMLGMLAASQVAGVSLLKERALKHPALLLFQSLGVFLIACYIGSNLLQGSGAGTLPFTPAPFNRALSILISIGIILGVSLFLRTRYYAKQVIILRDSPEIPSVWRRVATLQAAQIVGCLMLGAFSIEVHQGHFRAGTHWMVISALAVLATAGRPINAVVAASLLTLLELGLEHVPGLAGVARPLGILIFTLVALCRSSVWPASHLYPPNHWLPAFTSFSRREMIIQTLFCVGLFGALLYALIFVRGHRLVFFEFAVVLMQALIAFVGLRYFGVLTASWATFGGALFCVLLNATQQQSYVYLLFGIAIAALCVLHIAFIRRLTPTRMLLVDLSVIVVVFEIFNESHSLTGAQSSLLVAPLHPTLGSHLGGYFVLSIIGAVLIGGSWWLQKSRSGRLTVNAASDPSHASRHGLSTAVVTCIAALVLLALSTLVATINAGVLKAFPADRLQPLVGITSLFAGYVMATVSLVRGVVAVLSLTLAPVFLFGGYGEIREAIVGLLIILTVWHDAKNPPWTIQHSV